SFDFSQVAALLAGRYRLILFDYPGFGFSAKPRAGTYSLERYADAAQALLGELGLDRVCVLAHDIGDSVALELLHRRSPLVGRLVLLNGSVISVPIADPAMLLMQKALLNPLLGAGMSRLRLFRRPIFARTFQKLFVRRLSEGELRSFWALLRFNDGLAIYHRLIRYMLERRVHQERWLAALRRDSAPLTLIWGQDDPVAPPSIAERIAGLRPDARYVRLDGVGHYPHWEAPAQVAASVAAAFG
ncbi:MAG TPA: alpha/beta fold hydrolase, partial [Herpetosiphonaceae bacterium]|nr:alpha/beta fold hydrolase [Herpetosiphonaceae bacterium]